MSVFTSSAVVIALLMAAIWLISLRMKDVSIVDPVWGLGFVLVSWTAVLSAGSHQFLLPVLTTIWGLRLSLYLAWRNHGKPEDFRYQAMRRHHGESFPIVSLFTVFGLQGLVMWIVSLPLQAGAIPSATSWTWLRLPGILLWGVGVFFETTADWQLARFKSRTDTTGRVLDTGLWRYTRHPNYFGDFLVWWGLYLTALSVSGAWWTIIGPAVMSVFLMRVSGVTLLERTLRQTKPQYADYITRTNAFFPGRPVAPQSASDRSPGPAGPQQDGIAE